MEKRVSVRGIIIDGDELHTIFRRRVNDDETFNEYYVIPGGGTEKDETLDETLKRELKEELSKPIVIDGTTISLEYSLGVSIFPEDATDRQTLIMYADDAMYYIKEHGKNNYYFHNKALKAKLENKNKMQKDLKTA